MSQNAHLSTEQLEAQISSYVRAAKNADGNPEARATLKALLLEKERRHINAFTDKQLEAAIHRYENKASAGDQGAAKVLARLAREKVRRQSGGQPGVVHRTPGSHGVDSPQQRTSSGDKIVSVAASVGVLSGSSDNSTAASGPTFPQTRTPENGQREARGAHPGFSHVGGWLLFYCICLTIVAPVVSLGVYIAGVTQASQHFHRFPGLQAVCVLDGLLSAGVVAFGVYAGVSLWKIKRNAVQIAKAYLTVFLVGSAVSNLLLPLVAGLPSEATGAILKEGLRAMIWPYIGFSIWNSYLDKSKRVKATFGQA